MQTFTVFCESDIDVGGTTWIGAVSADNVESAKQIAKSQCAKDWGEYDPQDIRVIGVANGDVEILEWQD